MQSLGLQLLSVLPGYRLKYKLLIRLYGLNLIVNLNIFKV